MNYKIYFMHLPAASWIKVAYNVGGMKRADVERFKLYTGL